MKTRIFLLFLVPALLTLGACSDSLLVEPTSEITVNSFWNGPDDAVGGLYGMYTRFRDQAAYNLYYWGGARSDELSYGQQASEGRERYFLNTLDATAAGPDWLRLYTVVHDANLIIKYVPGIEFTTEQQKNDILAQAHAMRAYVYFIMARTWGGVPIVTEPTEGYSPETTFRPRGSVEEVFDLIKSDIETALSLFPTNDFPAGRNIWSRPAVNALKGDVYLWTGKVLGGGEPDLQTALEALQTVQTGDVGLLDDFDSVFRYANKGNREIIMAIHFADLESGQNFGADMYFRDDQIPVNATEYSRELLGLGGGLNRWAPSEIMRERYDPRDQRKAGTIVELYTTETGDSTFYGSAVLKFRGFVETGSRRFMDDIILYRYADVLLMIAEAKNALGQDPSEEINAVRQRAYGDAFEEHVFTNGGREANDEAILEERALELAYEGKRWWDLVRFDRAFELVPSLNGRESERYLLYWPISQTTISLNNQIEQNPGY